MQKFSIGHKFLPVPSQRVILSMTKNFPFHPSQNIPKSLLSLCWTIHKMESAREWLSECFMAGWWWILCGISFPLGVIAPLWCNRDMQCIIYYRRTRYMSIPNELPGNQHNTMQIHPKDNCMSRECRKGFLRAKHQQLSKMHDSLAVISMIINLFLNVI